MSATRLPLLNSYTAPKEVLDELSALAEHNEEQNALVHPDKQAQAQAKRFARAEMISGVGAGETYLAAMRLGRLEAETMPLDATPRQDSTRKRRWDVEADADSVQPSKRRSRWDEAPADIEMTPIFMGGAAQIAVSLDDLLPSAGYTIVPPPAGYNAIDRLGATPLRLEPGFVIHERSSVNISLAPEAPSSLGNLAFFRPQDAEFFAVILREDDEELLSTEELKERKILRLLLKLKNGTPADRKSALRQITAKARDFGAAPWFDKILPLLMERSIGDQERHLLVKVIERILFQLDDLVRPFVHKILVVIQPLLIDEDYYARVESREIISNLAKAAGLAHMISTMRPDIDHADEFVRSTTARAFSVVATALGIHAVIPFVKAVCRSRKSWQARHTGLRIVQQIALMVGAGVLPHLTPLVDCVVPALIDEQQKVRTMAALAIAALAEAATPFGIESFGDAVQPLWSGIRVHRGKGLAAFLKAVGCIIPLMDEEHAASFTKPAMQVLLREFKTSDEEMKRIVLKVVSQCVATDGVEAQYIRKEIIPQFFSAFWIRRTALDRRNYRQVVQTTVELAKTTGAEGIISRVVDGLKDDSEPYRKMVVETIAAVVRELGVSDVDERTEMQLVDGILYAFQEQTTDDDVLLDGFGTITNALGVRSQPYLIQIVSTILWRLNHKSAKVRQQAADLVTQVAVVIKQCGDEQLLGKLGVVLFEQLGEEYPDTLGSIVAALSSVTSVLGMSQMNPPVKDILSRLAPILNNRHEKVQEATINLIGRIADRGAEFVAAKEWMRISFKLLELLNARNKKIRRAAVNAFGYIAKSIGPQDVLGVLLTNLRVQERQSRVCSAIAIAVVAETCGAFTCIPAILNEYRSAELNVRTGCLKALTFVFEYIGPQAAHYSDSMLPLLEDALTERDVVHRQIASTIVKHVALGVVGMGCEDALQHLMNLVWPNCFETSPHVASAVLGALEAMQVALGPGVVLSYLLQGLFHPARKVREVYWRVYNLVYIGTSDALVPFYPDLGELGFSRNELAAFM